MTGSQIQISAALQRLQAEKRYFSIAVYRIDGEYAIRIASAGASCGQCEKVHLSTGNIGRVARSGVLHVIDDVSKDDSYRSCFSQGSVSIKVGCSCRYCELELMTIVARQPDGSTKGYPTATALRDLIAIKFSGY
jgi:hypothetical protein